MTASYELIEWTKQKINENTGAVDVGIDSLKIRCPFCGDSRKKTGKKRGNYYLKDGMYKCFNGGCEIYCDSFKLVAELEGSTIAKVKSDFFRYEHGGGGDFEYIDEFEEKPTSHKPEQIVIPENWVEIEEGSKKYIDERMITKAPNLSRNWRMFYNKISKRLVIPWIENGKMVFYQERALYTDQNPKYLFPRNVTDRPLFGIDNIDESYPWIFYLEGAIDSIWVKNGVAAGSISLSKSQMDTLSNFVGHQVVYFPDNPWVDKASLENIRKLTRTHPTLKVFMWPKNVTEKDVNEVICRYRVPELFYNDRLHENVVSIQKARCMLELM